MGVKEFVKREPVLTASIILAAVSLLFATPSADPSDYASIFKTICVLFCFMALVAGISQCNAINVLASKLLKGKSNTRSVCIILIMLPFFCAMLFSNDVALLTFVPIAIMILSMANLKKKIPLVVILQTAAAHSGSFLTPFGNPHNLFVYNHYEGMFTIWEYEMALIPIVITGALVILAIAFLMIKKEPIDFDLGEEKTITDRKSFYVFAVLFILSIISVLGYIPYYIMVIVIAAAALILMPKVLKNVDYCLLITFFLLYVFANNLASIESISAFLGNLMESQPMLTTVVTSQFTTNVASTIMLSSYTADWAALLVGADIGGFGTPIASMACIITITLYLHMRDSDLKQFFKLFFGINIVMLITMSISYFLFVA